MSRENVSRDREQVAMFAEGSTGINISLESPHVRTAGIFTETDKVGTAAAFERLVHLLDEMLVEDVVGGEVLSFPFLDTGAVTDIVGISESLRGVAHVAHYITFGIHQINVGQAEER